MSALPPLTLDDLTYDDLRQMALRRIPAASGGRWTHHAPVDAGVTLLELFAFLLEQQLFVLDQVSDSMTHAILALLGEAPRSAGVASTVVAPVARASWSESQWLPAGTAIRPEDAALDGLVFSTREETLLLPVAELEVRVDGSPISDRLERGERVSVFSGYGVPAELEIEAALGAALRAEDVGKPVAIGLILEEAGAQAEWHAEAVDVPPPAEFVLGWSRPDGGGGTVDWNDGTGGMRRSGLVRFAVPADAEGADRLNLVLSTEAATFASPPHLRAVSFGAAIVEHRAPVRIEPHETGDPSHDRVRAELLRAVEALLPNSGQVLDLPTSLSPVIGESLTLRLAEASGEAHAWRPVPELTAMSPADRVFRFDRALGRLFFGDGYAGRVPGASTAVELSLDLGGGIAGNHAAGMRWRLQGQDSELRLESLVAAEGGEEPETLEDARARTAASLNERYRAVTAEDYAALSENAPGLARHRAHVVAGLDPAFPCRFAADCLTVFVVPRTGEDVPAPRADDGALQVIRDRLDEARMLTTRVFVRRPRFRPVDLTLEVLSTRDDPSLTDRVRSTLSNYLHPSIGGPSGTGWPFGRPLRPSELLRVAATALESGDRVERVGIRLGDTGTDEESCSETAIGDTELVRLERLTVRTRRHGASEVTL